MKNKFNKLKELNDEISEEAKYNYLYNALPLDIIQRIGITVHQDKWNECKELLKKIVPRLKYLKTIRENQNRINAYNNETKINKSRNFRNNQNIKCYNCGKYSHVSRDCNYMKTSHNDKRKNNDYNRRNKQKVRNQVNAHGDSAEVINSQINKEQEELNYNEVYDNALNIDYNDDEKKVESCNTEQLQMQTLGYYYSNISKCLSSTLNKNDGTMWTLDSGASYYMTGDKNSITLINLC
ncbi:hypothetical protein PIROE2DRAFT_11264 [Piromyces sp. E2]|nr:hypothetical protein PIROE2DRAFT_11264 [Piromyces sp. E2]|eukprot:OUM62461.1 hypothetical protein PIROE2DRAFT_11264 [Piromyces sp. E2]